MEEQEYPIFVRWIGGPSLWVCIGERFLKLEEFLEEHGHKFSEEQRKRIGLLATNIIYRESPTTCPANPIRLLRGEVEKLLEILNMSEEDLCADIACEAI